MNWSESNFPQLRASPTAVIQTRQTYCSSYQSTETWQDFISISRFSNFNKDIYAPTCENTCYPKIPLAPFTGSFRNWGYWTLSLSIISCKQKKSIPLNLNWIFFGNFSNWLEDQFNPLLEFQKLPGLREWNSTLNAKWCDTFYLVFRSPRWPSLKRRHFINFYHAMAYPLLKKGFPISNFQGIS